MKTALIQMRNGPDKAANLKKAESLIAEAAARGTDIAVLPEMFCCEYRNRAFVENRERAGGTVWQMLSRSAADCGLILVGGSMPEEEDGRIYNTSFVFDGSGRQIARHRKMHLFDIDIEGGQSFRESATFTAGSDITTFETPFGLMGLCVCFDIRFPELCRIMSLRGAKVVFCPAAFNMTTGPAHWELLHRSRALEDQIFVAACAPARDENASYVSYGNSMVASPWGGVTARAGSGECILYADIDLSETDKVRRQLPLMSARRTDVYSLSEIRR